MEDIKSNFDRIMEQYNEGLSHTAPKKLSFESFNDSGHLLPKKRKISLDKSDLLGSSFNDSVAKNTSAGSLNSSIPSSPWEHRRMKADFAEAQARILTLKKEIERLQKLRVESETLSESKVRELTKQCDFTSNKCIDLEKHLADVRAREHAAKTELIKLRAKVTRQKCSYEEKVQSLQRTNADIEENARVMQMQSTNDYNELKRHCERLEMEFELATDELHKVKSQLETFQSKASAYDELRASLERTQRENEENKSRIKELEYEVSSYGDWKDVSKASHTRLAKLPELDRELDRLQNDNKNLLNTIGNKLLLEEQVYDLKSRLEKFESTKEEAIALRVEIKAVEKELAEWKKIGADHCPPNTMVSPFSLRSRIEDLLQKDIVLTSDQGANKSEKNSFEGKIHDLQKLNETYIKNNGELKKAFQHNKSILLRVQKRLMLVAKERDCYKQLVENFEKDLTISNALAEVGNPESQLRCRIEMLEKTLTGYKEMCENLEKEMAGLKSSTDGPLDMAVGVDNYDHFRKEMDSLRLENDRLKRRKEELELEMEHRCLKGDFNVAQFKVVHLANNPAAEAYESTKNSVEKLQAEIERLKRRNRKLEDDQEEMTCRLNETSNMTVNIKEMNTMRQKIESMEAKIQHMKEVYKSASLEFREVCYMLFGYKIDRVGNTNYRISSMYAESENEYLNFRLNESGILDMLETDYSVSLSEMMRNHLGLHASLPAFLSALTMDLFTRTTVAV